MTSKEILVVKNSWKIFQEIDPLLVGDVFYSKLFLIAPRLKNMFSVSTTIQSRKLIEMLNIIVGRLDRLDELTEDIRQLALRHVAYGVKAVHYEAVGSALLWTLEQGLGQDWTDETRAAWTACYELLSGAMIEGSGY